MLGANVTYPRLRMAPDSEKTDNYRLFYLLPERNRGRDSALNTH